MNRSSTGTAGRSTFFALLAIAVIIYGCAIYANLAFAVTDRAMFRYFPPFQANVNANQNRALGWEYLHIGKALAEGRGFADPFDRPTGATAWMPPILPALWASILWATDGSRDAVLVVAILLHVHVLIGTGFLVLSVARTTTRRFGAGAAVVVFLGVVLCQFRFSFQVTGDAFLVLLALDLVIAGRCLWQPLDAKKSAFCWGLIGGFCALVNPAVALTWGVATLLLAWRRRTLSRLAITVLAAAFVIAPWIVRNYIQFGRFIPVKSNLAYELYQSQCLQPDGLLQVATYNHHPGRLNVEGQQYNQLGEMEFLDRKSAQFRQAVADDPLDYLDRVALRFLGATVWYVPFNRQQPVAVWLLPAKRLAHPIPFIALLVLVFSSLVAPLSRTQWSVIGVYLLYLAPYILASYYERYGYPLLVVKALLILWAADRLLTCLAGLDYRKRGWTSVSRCVSFY